MENQQNKHKIEIVRHWKSPNRHDGTTRRLF